MEAVSLAVSVSSPIFKLLGAKAASSFGGDITEEELQDLQTTILPKIQAVLSAADAVPVEKLKPWLRTLQAAVYEAEDVLDLYEYKRLQAQVSSLPDPLKTLKKKAKDFFAPLFIKTELKRSMEKIRKSAEQAKEFIPFYGAIIHTQLLQDTNQQQQQRRQQPTTVSSPSSPIFGRDEERESLVNMLIPTTNKLSSSERRTPILAIYGIGGAGKTTLAQSVYNDSIVEKHFRTRMWVHVSRMFDAREITIKIIESATKGGESSKDITSLSVLQTKVEEILKSDKFLIVFDDVWCEDCWEWDQMLIPLNKVGGTESRILVTTRREEVASRLGIENVVPLKDLKADECMSIFKHYSLGDANKVIDDPQIAKIAEQIMMKLEKSPLSARIVGSLLRGKKSIADWKQIYSKGEMLKDTVATLYLSFENLEPHLQRCFAFCSLYPKGYYFYQGKVDRLVRFWIAQDFVEVSDDDNMTIEDKGMQYFNELLSHSFFQKETTSYGVDYYIIHDLLHDLAEEVSKDHCYRIEDDTLHIPPTVMHLSLSRKKDLSSNIKSEIFKLLNLRTFFIDKISKADFNSIFDARSKMFEKLKKLRVLHLGFHEMSELHKSVGQLKHLRYFQLREVDRLPESLGRLYHLQFLNLRNNTRNNTRPIEKVPEVPENLNNLINMRFLLAENEIISKIPFIGRLTSLQNLAWFGASRKAGHGVGQLKYLRELRGSLRIDNLENVQDKAEASEASLNEKKLLEKLSLEWTYSPERDGRIDEEVIDGLEPSPNLNEVKIRGYNGVELPKWLLNGGGVSNPQFSRLSTLSVNRCPELKQVPSLPSTLKTVVIERCENLCEASSLPPGLRVVRVIQCPKLTQLCPFPPNLEKLEIEECPGVETLLADVLLFESRDEQQQQQEKEQLQLKTLSIKNCSVSGGKKRHFGSRNNKLLSSLSKLELLGLPWLASLLLLPDLTSLEDVCIVDCENLELFGSSASSFDLLPSSLKMLRFRNCGDPEMNLLKRCLRGLTSLTVLDVGGYSHARSLPDLANPGAIEELRVSDCPELASMWNLQRFASLKTLYVTGCPKLIVVGGEALLLPPSLTRLTIDDLSLLRRSPCLNALSRLTIQDCREGIIAFAREQEEELFPHLTSLTQLWIKDCPNLTSVAASLEKLSSLSWLIIEECPEIESLPNLPASLERLSIYKCPKMESLPNLPTASLEHLEIRICHPQLKVSYGEGGPLHHKVRHIPYLFIH